MQRDEAIAGVCGVGGGDGVSGISADRSSGAIAFEYDTDCDILQCGAGIADGSDIRLYRKRIRHGGAAHAVGDGNADIGIWIIWPAGVDNESNIRG